MTKKRKSRQQYSKELKMEPIKLAAKIGLSQASEDLGISNSLLFRWRTQLTTQGPDALRGSGNLCEKEAELRRLRRGNEKLKQERELLKEATRRFLAGLQQ